MPQKLEHILYVDDDETLREVIQMALENIGGMQVSLCEDGSRVPELARTLCPQLILMDVQMPGQSGPEVAAVLQQDAILGKIPVIFISAQEMDVSGITGAIGFIRKPVDLAVLPQQITGLWNQKQGVILNLGSHFGTLC